MLGVLSACQGPTGGPGLEPPFGGSSDTPQNAFGGAAGGAVEMGATGDSSSDTGTMGPGTSSATGGTLSSSVPPVVASGGAASAPDPMLSDAGVGESTDGAIEQQVDGGAPDSVDVDIPSDDGGLTLCPPWMEEDSPLFRFFGCDAMGPG